MQREYDVIIRNGTIVDGSGRPAYLGDIGIAGRFIANIGRLEGQRAAREIDARGLVVAPGFINVMSWAPITLLADGRGMGDLKQGVTLEVFGEAWSEGPLSPEMKSEYIARQDDDFRYDVPWDTLGGFLDHLAAKGVTPNIASYVGATTLRIYAMGYANRPATETELATMRGLVDLAMREGALGVSTALIYPPGGFAQTAELIELARVAAQHGGIYISHLRSEGSMFEEALEELITIAREAGARAEVYHLKAMGRDNWHKMERVLARIDRARQEGLHITADMYPYLAGGTGLSATMPPWVQEGGHEAWMARLREPEIRAQMKQAMLNPSNEWENMYLNTGGPENIYVVEVRTPALKPLEGKSIAEIAAARGTEPTDTIIDLILEDNTRVEAIYFTMSEDNLRAQVVKPWVCIGSDAPSQAPEGVFAKSKTHPRAYGAFARYLSQYVRDEKLVSLEEGVRKITSLPASTLRLDRRGKIEAGYYADLAIFDLDKVRDTATFADPQQYAQGMAHVLVNGALVLADGEHTGAMPGMVARGPGYQG